MLTGDQPLRPLLEGLRSADGLGSIPVILGVPLVGSPAGLRHLLELPGLARACSLAQRLGQAPDLRAAGLAFATELAGQARALRDLGVAGLHVMPFGVSARETAAWIKSVQPDRRAHPISRIGPIGPMLQTECLQEERP